MARVYLSKVLNLKIWFRYIFSEYKLVCKEYVNEAELSSKIGDDK